MSSQFSTPGTDLNDLFPNILVLSSYSQIAEHGPSTPLFAQLVKELTALGLLVLPDLGPVHWFLLHHYFYMFSFPCFSHFSFASVHPS